VNVHVYVLIPEQTGSGLMTGPVIVNGSPQELLTAGGVGTVCASLTQGTVEPPSAGKLKVGGSIVYVYTQSPDVPEQSVYVQVYVLMPEQTGSGLMTGPVTVSGSPHELEAGGGVGITCASVMHGTVDPSSGGNVNTGGVIV
jgi:hypothetical protein